MKIWIGKDMEMVDGCDLTLGWEEQAKIIEKQVSQSVTILIGWNISVPSEQRCLTLMHVRLLQEEKQTSSELNLRCLQQLTAISLLPAVFKMWT